jgi:O-antigen biosynthesis protein
MRCSVIISVPEKATLTRQRLERLRTCCLERVDAEIIIVDHCPAGTNGHRLGGDGDRIRVVAAAAKAGAASRRNGGASAAVGKYLVFLSSDMVPKRGWLDALVNYAECHPRVAAVGSKLLFSNGTIQHAGVVIDRTGMPRHVYSGFPADHPAVNKSRRFQAVSGSGMLIRRALFEELAGFDPTFEDGYEDVDLCLRLTERGWGVHYCHESVLYRIESTTREIHAKQEERDAETYRSRWAHRVRPDDVCYFVEDGLLRLDYQALYPICLSIAPELAAVKVEDQDGRADRFLGTRTQQVLALIKDNVRLNARVRGVELPAPATSNNGAAFSPWAAMPPPPGLDQRSGEPKAGVSSEVKIPADANADNGDLPPPTDPGPSVPESNPAASEPPTPEPSPPALEFLGRSKLRSFLAARQTLVFPKVEQPVVTIVIPTFNKAPYTYLALESLLSSEPDLPFELVLVDNASTDETRALLKQLENVRTQLNERNLGFGDACNLGANMARGEYVCFLNSDTLLTPGWLSALVRTIRSYPQCGAVGAKLVHPDRKLQEAGSIIWNDGSTCGFGRGADPLQPEFGYLREVDYCSAACLLIRKDLLVSVGGFDDRYAPAYYEDADLCLSIRQAGYKVVYQPNAVVFHVEFGSSDTGKAVDLQLRNRSRFITKWGDRLLEQSPPLSEQLWTARDRRQGRRILVIDDWIPAPGLGMGLPRTRALLDALVALGYVVTFLPFLEKMFPEPATTQLRQAGVEVLDTNADQFGRLQERPDLYDAVIVSRPNKREVMEVVKRLNPTAPLIYDAEAIFALRDIRQAEVEGRPLSAKEADSLIREELALTELADVVITVSDGERRLFQSRKPNLRVAVWGHAIAARRVEASFRQRQDLLFVGNLGTAPNAAAVIHLLGDIFPMVRTQVGCRLYVVGSGATAEVIAWAYALPEPGAVVLPGFVDDLAAVYDRCRVFVAPHRFAAGIPLKVIEAMSNGVPCVISQLLADQLGVSNEVEALVAKDAQEFADKVVRLYQDQELWQRVQHNALHWVETRCDPAAMQKALGQCIEEAIARKKSNRAARISCPESIRAETGTEATAGLRS